ncbi:MAG: 1-deoxy-D-xylulose-5-phosphate reductoisomerase [Alphaproteobacteria bacterium]
MNQKEAAPRTVAILVSTGSIGTQTLDLIARYPNDYVVEALTAASRVDLLAEQARRFKPRFVAIADPGKHNELKAALADLPIEVGAGPQSLIDAAERPTDFVMASIIGAAGLAPTLAAVRRGGAVGLANKECLVCAGALFNAEVRKYKATLLPVDSEHNAIFQVFDFKSSETIEKLILTASGGPFRSKTLAEMKTATPAEAVAHPNWSMGAKISIDSATMMNKGLELIEAYHLFDIPEERIDILVHPQSIIHSMVSYVDGSVLAQLGTPDMRTPIAYALAWPTRIVTPTLRLDLAQVGKLTFEAPDIERFPSLRLAREALRKGGSAPTILNAANEVGVSKFLENKIGFLDIVAIVEETMTQLPLKAPANLDDVISIDREARTTAHRVAGRFAK